MRTLSAIFLALALSTCTAGEPAFATIDVQKVFPAPGAAKVCTPPSGIDKTVRAYQGEAAIYEFKDDEALRIGKMLEHVFQEPFEVTVDPLAHIVLWLSTDEVSFYLYSEGCKFLTSTTDIDFAVEIMVGSQLTPPFNRTFYQLPGVQQ